MLSPKLRQLRLPNESSRRRGQLVWQKLHGLKYHDFEDRG